MAALPASLSALFISIRNLVLGREGLMQSQAQAEAPEHRKSLLQSQAQAEAAEQPEECEGRACLTSTG